MNKRKIETTKVFGPSTMAFNPTADGEMGPYPVGDGEMGPYPLSDNTNLLSSSNYGMSLYRNYGSSYGTNYASCNLYTAKYSNKKSNASTSATTSNLNNNTSYEACNRMHCAGGSASNTKCNTPVPTRRSAKRERDSFRRHSAHGRMSTSQGTISNSKQHLITPLSTHTKHKHTRYNYTIVLIHKYHN